MMSLKVVSALALLAVASCSGINGYSSGPYNAGGYNSGAFNSGAYNSGASNNGGFNSGYSGGFSRGAHIPILRYENVNNGDGNYRYSYETGNGISARESGSPRAPGPEGPAVTAEGDYSYTAPDGQRVSLTYTADENGFHPTGSHIPTPPPIPEAILRSLQFNRQNPSSDDGSYNPGRHNGGYHY